MLHGSVLRVVLDESEGIPFPLPKRADMHQRVDPCLFA